MGNICNCEDAENTSSKELSFPAVPSVAAKTHVSVTDEAQDEPQHLEVVSKEDQEKVPTFEFVIHKIVPEESLGMDVRHSRGTLEIVQLSPEGAAQRANVASARARPPGETLRLGDVIHRVNDISKSDHHMVAECRLKTELRLRVARPRAGAP
mmetsp:Transcript_17688/g.51638  ORF Transcript_17688/g.51638 Transcript_17688/m.51638 type:complete len:153 (-) Transcript_17688:56-514(-)